MYEKRKKRKKTQIKKWIKKKEIKTWIKGKKRDVKKENNKKGKKMNK